MPSRLEHHHAPTPPPPQPPEAVAPIAAVLPIVHHHVGVVDPEGATAQTDGRLAVVQRGVLTLQMRSGQQLVSDGTPAPDVRVLVDAARPGPYQVEIGVGHNVFIVVAAAAHGTADIDIDAAGVRIGRFVRVSTRVPGSAVAVDAVLVRTPSGGS